MVDLAEQWLTHHLPVTTDDPRACAAVLVSMQMGLLAMHEHVSRALGADVLAPDGHLRMSRASLDLYSQPLLDPELTAQARAALDRLDTQPRVAAKRSTATEGAHHE
jgi:hypothetical protein